MRKILLILAPLMLLASCGKTNDKIVYVDKTDPTVVERTDPPRSEPEHTDPPRTTQPALGDFEQWFFNYGPEVVEQFDIITQGSQILSEAESPSELVELCTIMLTAVTRFQDSDPANDLDAPKNYVRVLDSYGTGLDFCTNGDFETGGDYIGRATGYMNDFTAEINTYLN